MPGVHLITGATGFAGSHLLDLLAARGRRIHAWSHRGSAAPRPHSAASADGDITWSAIDILDRAAVRQALGDANPAVVYHCAGAAHVKDAWQAPAHALRINALGTHNVLESVRELGLRCRVLVTGSALVYTPQAAAIAESSPIGASDPYGVSKLAQEMIASNADPPALIVRPFNHAGPRQSPAFATSAFAKQIAEIEAGRRPPVLQVGNLEAKRDLTDVRDTVRAYEAIAERGEPGRPYNVCSGRAHSMRGLLDLLLSLSTISVRVEQDASLFRPLDNPIVLGSHARVTEDTGWTPQIPIERTMADLLGYWRGRTATA